MEVWDCGTQESSQSLSSRLEPVRHGAPPESWKPRVSADVNLADAVLTVKNRGKEDWPALTVKLEAADGSEFTAQTPPLRAGGAVEIPLAIFVSKSSEPLSRTNSFKKVSIGGNGFQFGAYRL